MPLIREGRALGAILVRRADVRPFEQKHIALLTTFADQAAIAIENVRLFKAEQQRTRELSKSLNQQTAISEVLQVISSSPGELEPVFAAMLVSVTRICEAKFGNLLLREGDAFRAVAWHGEPTYVENWRREPLIVKTNVPHIPLARLVDTKQRVHVATSGRKQPTKKVLGLLSCSIGDRSTQVVEETVTIAGVTLAHRLYHF